MTGLYLPFMSWEKQRFYLMDNGYVVRVEQSVYGDMVAAIESVGSVLCRAGVAYPISHFRRKVLYHCSHGWDTFPEWAKVWIRPVALGHWMTIMAPDFRTCHVKDLGRYWTWDNQKMSARMPVSLNR